VRGQSAPIHNNMSEEVPLILETGGSDDYALLDSGHGRKLERYGAYHIIRPEAQALWHPCLSEDAWRKADAVFTGNIDEEGMGRWHFPHGQLGESWEMAWDHLPFLGRFTSFRHVGVFPEQEAHWRFIEHQIAKFIVKKSSDSLIKQDGQRVRLLNLFGYTGLASLVAARAGAQVTHVDASKKAIGWAKENQHFAGLDDKPIRWICDDALKFVERESRRGKFYDIIVLDPPHYGRGPRGEVWQLFEHLPKILRICRNLLTPDHSAASLILTAYSIRASFYALHELMRENLSDLGGRLQSGELILRQLHGHRALSTSLFSRWIAE